jgi:hypothetical protein
LPADPSIASARYDKVIPGRSPHLANGKSETSMRFQFLPKLKVSRSSTIFFNPALGRKRDPRFRPLSSYASKRNSPPRRTIWHLSAEEMSAVSKLTRH